LLDMGIYITNVTNITNITNKCNDT
jgi:hypothetical protein